MEPGGRSALRSNKRLHTAFLDGGLDLRARTRHAPGFFSKVVVFSHTFPKSSNRRMSFPVRKVLDMGA